ncbi:MAG: hypothetical protein PHE25_01120 [Candidatus Gracilibacteria bacterium]|nr:hypothetical protein [Candidatus Gracilibacteria bacterium]
MDIFRQKIQDCIKTAGLTFPGIDENVIIDKTLASAEEYVLTNIAADLLSREDKNLFRDAIMFDPDMFDADEFLSTRVPNYDMEVDKYFDVWLEDFKNNL